MTECVQQTMVMKYADRYKPLPQLPIYHAGVTLFPTCLLVVKNLTEQVERPENTVYCLEQYHTLYAS